MIDCITQYYRCPEAYCRFVARGPSGHSNGFFRLGEDITCYGNYCGDYPTNHHAGTLSDALSEIEISDGTVYLPFDPSQIVDNLRRETYAQNWRGKNVLSVFAELYYFLRPFLPVGIRKRLQKLYLNGWEEIPFPHWPVDFTVDKLLERLFLLAIRASGAEQIPFIWFWPNGAPSCAIMSHDVETMAGREFCKRLMDIEDSFGVKSSFEVIPEQRYKLTPEFLDSIRQRGFEVAVHDLNHDGHLYRDHEQFLGRVAKINSYGREYGAKGFRAGVLYRKQLWYDALQFEYDMSIPNVAHLDPQRGGCCTVMPYFIGNILELPVTTTQDYTLFNILNEYSTDLWKQQIKLIMERHGLMSFIVHPDYVLKPRELGLFEELLAELAHLRQERRIWIALPSEVNCWWRQRAQMQLIREGDGWKIEGEGVERARIAYASEKDGELVFSLPSHSVADCLDSSPTTVSQTRAKLVRKIESHGLAEERKR